MARYGTINRRKKKFRINFKGVLAIVILIGIIYGGYSFYNYKKQENILNNKEFYSEKEISLILKNGLFQVANGVDQDTTVFMEISKEKNEKDLFKSMKKLSKKGYAPNSVVNIYKSATSNDFIQLSKKDYNRNLNEFAKVSYFEYENFKRYESYYGENPSFELEKVILNVNLGISEPHYTNIKTIENPDDLFVLVNKYHQLPSNFVPKDLVTLSSQYSFGTQQMRSDAAVAFKKLVDAVKGNGLKGIAASSGYRSIKEQEDLYNRYVSQYGQEYADNYSARPGHSEHHLGLTVDIVAVYAPNISIFDQTPEYEFVKENAHKYGFVIHYTPDKIDITGYQAESWHLRYLGVELATYLYEHQLTLDEYYAMHLDYTKSK